MNSQKLTALGRQIIAARQAGHDVAELAQSWSDALRKATVAGDINGAELDVLTDFEYAVHGHPAAEFFATVGAALNEAHARGDTEEAKRLYRRRAEVLQQYATWYQIKNEKIYA